jgi:hypothetical protein
LHRKRLPHGVFDAAPRLVLHLDVVLIRHAREPFPR